VAKKSSDLLLGNLKDVNTKLNNLNLGMSKRERESAALIKMVKKLETLEEQRQQEQEQEQGRDKEEKGKGKDDHDDEEAVQNK